MRIAAAMAAVALLAGAAAHAQSSDEQVAELAEARAIMEIAFPPSDREQTFATLMAQVGDQFRDSLPTDGITDPQLLAILDRYLGSIPERLGPTVRTHLPNIIEATAVAYTNEFTLAELQDIRAFAESPSGKRYLQRSTALVGDPAVAAANTAFFTDVQEIQAAFQGELIQDLSTYLAEHPEAAAELLGSAGAASATP